MVKITTLTFEFYQTAEPSSTFGGALIPAFPKRLTFFKDGGSFPIVR